MKRRKPLSWWKNFPVILSGQIARRGETDYYAFDAAAGQKLTFQAISGLPVAGAPGGNAAGFDPSVALYEPSGSWFDPKRINRIAFNDEPLWIIGKRTDAYLVHSFAKKGRYLLRIEAFSGQGGPDYGYQIKITPGEAPQDEEPGGDAGRSATSDADSPPTGSMNSPSVVASRRIRRQSKPIARNRRSRFPARLRAA